MRTKAKYCGFHIVCNRCGMEMKTQWNSYSTPKEKHEVRRDLMAWFGIQVPDHLPIST